MGRMYLDKMTLPDGRQLSGYVIFVPNWIDGYQDGGDVGEAELEWLAGAPLSVEEYNETIVDEHGKELYLNEWAIEKILADGEEVYPDEGYP